MATIQIDGSIGGGQVLRSALSLSVLTGQSFVIESIRSQRKRSGLMRQHLTAVRAAAQICGAELVGDELGSTRLEFRPGPVVPGSYRFVVGSAGSACLVLQTVLPPLVLASAKSELVFEGGTHNPLAPPYPYLDAVVLPIWERMGVGITRNLLRAGFNPAGGGKFEVAITPTKRLAPVSLLARGALVRLSAVALVANLPQHVAERELAVLEQELAIPKSELHIRTPEAGGPGNALWASAEFEHITELMVDFGEQGLRAEALAHRVAKGMNTYLKSDAVVGEHLADQLLIPLASR
jgi:RNA 3'-terminal phosphate cyclase (ATP)